MALQDFPEMAALFEKLQAEKAELYKKSKPLRDEYQKLHDQAEPLEVKMRELAKQFKAIELPRMAEIDQQLAAIARATGGAVMSEGT